MADTVSMDDIVLEVRRLSGQETIDEANAFVTDEEIESRANRNLRKVYNALRRARGAKHYVKTAPDIVTTSGTSSYALPSDCLEVLTVSRQFGANEWEPLLDYNDAERHDFDWRPLRSLNTPARYQIQAGNINFIPTPGNGDVIRVTYVPSFVPISGAETFDGVAGFEEWAIWETVAELQAKDKDDPSLAIMKAKWWEQEVESMSKRRDGLMPPRVQRVRRLRKAGYFR